MAVAGLRYLDFLETFYYQHSIIPFGQVGYAAAEKILGHYKLLGQSVGKALQDNRMMDIALSYTFYR